MDNGAIAKEIRYYFQISGKDNFMRLQRFHWEKWLGFRGRLNLKIHGRWDSITQVPGITLQSNARIGIDKMRLSQAQISKTIREEGYSRNRLHLTT